ncbi:DUF2207 domain-containing protein [Nonomuraea muscovyensis]|uniref:Uncharacterized protein (TIGR04222 family) n=1 Tax=Nonomuraea muscovyensis TaxID=1124761 RepID=A0A7X0C819_9ACTN|nr:DUF2207 domain-containing protein [Nonomuraea muscovyensis]MBB6350262.1 uncharacterized protein (TIGR04222 family) [Nonomuraea muscovyensis]
MTGIRRVLAVVGAAVLALTSAPAMAGAGITDEITMTLRKDGTLHVVEKITGGSGELKRTFLTRTRHDDGNDRLYRIANVKGGKLAGDVLTVTAPATVEYDVKGAVTPAGQAQELRWFAVNGWNTPVAKATVEVSGPGQVQNLSCFAGDLTSVIGCTAASMDHGATEAVFEQDNLAAGQALTVIVGYPEGSSSGAPILERRFSLATAFTLDTVTGGALAALLALMLGGLGLLYWTRGRDARVIDHEKGVVAPVQNGHFSPPDGVRPGQIGTLVDEQADVIDVTATIVDLAVRGYLRIDEQPRQTYDAPDWVLVKLPTAPPGSLLPYEQALHDAIFDGRDAVPLSQLSGSFTSHLGEVRDALYDDVVRQGWFARRPDTERTRWTTLGVVLIVAGLLATAALAWMTTYGLIGLAVVIGGGALAVGGQYMPAKTAKGSAALAHTLAFREYLFSGDLGEVPEQHRVELFSRYLPYAVIFDGVEHWSRVVASVTGNGRQADNLYWYHGPAEWDLSKFAGSMRTFTTTTSGAISATRQFRSL